jgi:hypothetical protein
MQHANYRTTTKHYFDRREVAKQMTNNGFLIFDKNAKRALQHDTPVIKKRLYISAKS